MNIIEELKNIKYKNISDIYENFKIDNQFVTDITIFILKQVERIWVAPQLDEYVDHGINHSLRIIDILFLRTNSIDSILKEYSINNTELTDLEKYVLFISAFIHDIGMQYSAYPSSGYNYDKNTIEGRNKIRQNHCELGFDLYKREIYNKINKDIKNYPNLNYLYYSLIPSIAFAHCSKDKEFWDKMMQDYFSKINKKGIDKLDNKKIRPPLIASLLKLADELDTTNKRIIKTKLRLNYESLEINNKAHWYICNFIDDIELLCNSNESSEFKKDINKVIYINLIRFKHENEKYDEFIEKLMFIKKDKIDEECKLTNEILSKYPLGLNFKTKEIKESKPTNEEFPIDIIEYFKLRSKSTKINPKFLQKINISEELKNLDKEIQDKLNNYNSNNIHIKLKTGYHTNKYLNLKSFIECSTLSNNLAFLLKKYFKEKKVNIDTIIGIGSFGSSVGSLLSILLNTNFIYMINPIYIKKGYYDDVINKITNKDIKTGRKLLVIDDILSEATATETLLEEINKKFNNSCEIYLFIIYLLGKFYEINLNLLCQNIFYIIYSKKILYYQELIDNKCENCKENEKIYEDIFFKI